ncbi:AI-2E family transporter [Hymenobacter lutimineralis]|uniref:AI-2E family transporter n=1 Tax=Hymenobacter lutimineralis TaxID=2606448 RepID=A0A5D6UTE5_9BACT|nr:MULTISPECIES: AI-2E family transporter [Hymenobacter]QIX59682.1 AI-2E family transporter [Hymenobacter sp. BT18]TYZ06360.1 AI-2E family transporter [Hymenobacter lutimineralis]
MFPPSTQHHLPPSGHKPNAEVRQAPVIQFAFLLLAGVLLVYSLKVLDDVLLPLLFSALFALLLLPISRWLELKGVPRVAAIILCLLLMVVVFTGIVFGFGSQLGQFKNELPKLQDKLLQFFHDIQTWAANRFGIDPMTDQELKESTLKSLKKDGGSYLNTTLNMTSAVIGNLLQVPIYIFCFLYYRDHLRQFLFRFVAPDKRTAALNTLDNIQTVVQAYISGLFKVIVIVAVLNGIGLLALQVKFAIFFAIFASVLAVIPYIGIMIGASVPAIITLVETGSPLHAAGVIGVFAFVQFLEGNFITPMITGSQVSINPMAAIVALVLGAELWGTPGMILSIPLIAVIKVVLDANKATEPWGFLLGDTAEGEDTIQSLAGGEPGFFKRLWGRITGQGT